MRISDWSSDVCSSDLIITRDRLDAAVGAVVGERRRQPRIVEARQIPKVDMGVDEGNLRHSTLSHLSGRRFLAGGCPLSVRRRQNVVRPPEVSKVDAVLKLHSSLAMIQTIAALSSWLPSRPLGILERMRS